MIGGPPPKDADDRLRRNKDTIPITTLDWDGKTRGPELPEGTHWFKQTTDWWQHWRDSAQATVMTDLDWDELLMAAILYNEVWRTGKVSPQAKVQCLAQVRRVTAAFGATFEDRLKLRMQVRTDQTDKEYDDRVAQDAYKAVNYAEKLLKKVAEQKAEKASQED